MNPFQEYRNRFFFFKGTVYVSKRYWNEFKTIFCAVILRENLAEILESQLTGEMVVAGKLSSCSMWSLEHMGFSCSMWDLNSPTRDQTRVPCIARWILNHWTTREVPGYILMLILISVPKLYFPLMTFQVTLAHFYL